MNADLLKAERELARGNPDEARVYAWNALATSRPEELPRLLKVAEELDDELLVREIEGRGVVADELPKAARSFQLKGLIFPIAIMVLLLFLALNTLTSEPGSPDLKKKDTSLLVEPRLPILAENSGVWLVRLGHSELVPIRKLAQDVNLRYRIPVGVLPEIAVLPTYVAANSHNELDADALLSMLSRWYVARNDATVIGITDYPMSSDALRLRRPFMLRDRVHYGVVSTADLGAFLPDRLRGHTRYERTRKLVARGIGFLHLHRPESSDPHSLLRSQMSGTGDIDALDERL